MSAIHCPLCTIRVSDWMMVTGKAEVIGDDVVHKGCIMDYELKTGLNFREVHESTKRKDAKAS